MNVASTKKVFEAETKWRECGLMEKISFRGTERESAVKCGFREGTERGSDAVARRFPHLNITRGGTIGHRDLGGLAGLFIGFA